MRVVCLFPLLSFLILLFSFDLINSETISRVEKIHCANGLFCNTNSTGPDWKYYDNVSKMLASMVEFGDANNLTSLAMIKESEMWNAAMRDRKLLCKDLTFTGFLLDDESKNWPTQCVWNGREFGGMCVPAPEESNSIFYYIKPEDWQRRIRVFRKKIGCTEEEIMKIREAGEQFVCRERCLQAGISYSASMIMLFSFCISFMINCV